MSFFMRVDLFSTIPLPNPLLQLHSSLLLFLSLPPIFVLDEPEAQTNQPPVPQSDSPSDSSSLVAPVPPLIPSTDTSVSNPREPFPLHFSTSG